MFSSNTELLTSEGFVPFPDIDPDHEIAQFHPDTGRFMNFDIPDHVIADRYCGSMLSLQGKVSLCITPDTYLYASRSNNPENRIQPQFSLRSADEALSATQVLYQAPLRLCRVGDVRNCSEIGHDEEMYAYGQLIGFFLGDGHAESTNQLVFNLTKQRKRDYLRGIMSHIAYELKQDGERFVVRYPFLGQRFREWFYTEGGDKRLPSFMFSGTVPYYLGILDGLKHSDGYQRPNTQGWMYTTTSPHLIGSIQAMGAIVGEAFSVSETVDGLYRLYTLTRQIHPHINDSRTGVTFDTIDYVGWVYDVIMPHPLICVRHQQTTILCGASRSIGQCQIVY